MERDDSELLVAEGIWPWPDDPWELVRLYGEIIERRGQPGTPVLTNASGDIVTPAGFCDHAAEPSPAGRSTALVRGLSQALLGHRPEADFVLTNLPHLAFTQGSGFEGLALAMEPQLYVQEQGGSRMRGPVNQVVGVAWSTDASAVAFLEWRGPARVDGRRFFLWEEEVASGRRRVLATFGDELDWSGARLSYSPDGRWLLAAATLADGGPYLLDRESGEGYVLPLTADSAVWNHTAGPGHVLVTRREPPGVVIADLDLTTGLEHRVGQLASPTGPPLYLTEIDLSADGRWLAGTAPALDLDPGHVQAQGTRPKAVVVDLEQPSMQAVLPSVLPGLPCERTHSAPRWTRRPTTSSGGFQPADHLLGQRQRHGRPSRDEADEGELASRFRANYQACLDAARSGAVQLVVVWTELLWFATAAANLSVKYREELAEVAASLPPTLLAQGEWRQLRQELDRLARA
jgi:hypothetical protein